MQIADAQAAFLFLRAATEIVEGIQSRLFKAGYTDVRPAHGFVFVRVAAGGATTSAVAEQLGVSKQAAAQLVGFLVSAGYLQRLKHPTDARARLLGLTARGRACTRVAEAAASEITGKWRRLLGKARGDVFFHSLASVVTSGPIRPSF